MHIILFILIAALFLEQLGQNFLYREFDFIVDIIGHFQGFLFYVCGAIFIFTSALLIYKSIKIYIAVGNQLFARQGKLSKVFEDFLILTQNREKIAVKFCEIKFISML